MGLIWPLILVSLIKAFSAEECEITFSENGLNYSTFATGVGHGLHSLSLEEIRYFFEEDAPENNGVPRINIDLRSEQKIHLSSPLWGYEDTFDTWALKIMDWFMKNNKPNQFVQGLTALEKIGHQYHMHEIYQKAAVIYKELVANPPADKNLCSCVNDVQSNNVLEVLEAIFDIFKNFKKKSPCGDGRKARVFFGYGFFYAARKHLCKPLKGDQEEEGWIPGKVRGPKTWHLFASMLEKSMLSEEAINDFAVFMYCKLNEQIDN